MPIPFTCPHCGASSTVDDRFAGQSGPCGSCGKPITVPYAAASFGAPAYGAPAKPSGGGGGMGIVIGIIAAVVVAGGCVVAVCAGPLLFGLGLPGVQAARSAAQRTQSANNLKQIGLALMNYHDANGQFPPAYVTDADGKPLYSWRVLILPYLEQSNLYQQWDKTKAWDSPENMALSNTILNVYRSPNDDGPPTGTNYFVVVGANTAFPPDKGIKMFDMTDGTSNTITVIETKGIPGNWAAPIDPSLDKLTPQVGNLPGQIQPMHNKGTNVLMGDGSVRFLSETTNPQTIQNLLIRNDGNVIQDF
jgi:prepilin-type processing-associated H-X9-DG protein